MHKEIKNFSLHGTITGDSFVVARERLIREVEASMRDEGYVPVLDLLPHFTREYDSASGNFDFDLTIYGMYVGDEAWQVSGMTNGKIAGRSTQKTK